MVRGRSGDFDGRIEGGVGAGAGLAAGGSLLAGLAAASCCVLPLALATLGVGGAWLGQLTVLAPYRLYFLGFSAACLAYGFFRVYGRGGGVVRASLWLATAVTAAAAFPYVLPWFFGG